MYPAPEGPDPPTDTTESAACRRLWLSVLLRATRDSEGIDMMVDTEEEVVGYRKEAMEWLTTESEELDAVCEWANVSMENVVRMARGRYYGVEQEMERLP